MNRIAFVLSQCIEDPYLKGTKKVFTFVRYILH